MTGNEELKAKLNLETGKLAWQELERFFARGVVIYLKPGLDLVEVACAITQDQKNEITKLLASGQVSKPSVDQVEEWHQDKQVFWAVVVSPWILIQEVTR
jgi:hypothetical protein